MVPNLRFSSFTDLFRLYTLKDVLHRVSIPVNVDENKLYYQIGIRSHSKGIFYKEAETGKQIGNKRIFLIEPNCLILNIVFAWEQAVAKTSEKEVGMVASHRFPMYKVLNNSLDYIVDFFKTEKGKQLLQMASPGGAGRNKTLNQDFFLNSKIYLPSLNEQLKTSNLIELIEDRIEAQIKIIDTLLSEMNSIRSLIFNKSSLKWIPLKDIVAEQDIKLKRGKVIPKHKKNLKYIYPVYSSSITNSGLMGYSDSYMFNQELITWSIDGGGNFFYRKKHKFNITNVSGYMILNENLFNYQFIVQSLIWQHEKFKFDYQTKAHPSVVESLYKIPIMDLEEQHKYACLFSNLNEKYELELHILDLLNMQKKYLLKNMFV